MQPHPYHWLWNVVFLLVFCAGQFLFMLKRADLAKSSQLNGVKTIGEFFTINWVKLLFRAAIEWGIVLWPYRSASGDWLQTVIGKLGVNLPFQIPSHRGLAGCFFAGVCAELVLDWVLGKQSILGIPIPAMLKEQIPQLPQVTQLVDTLTPKQ
jgi:hypothetical protein